jgi:type II secretory pathway pseudopilin PulG
MRLQGQLAATENGYAMAALLVALSVMGILASAAMPTWKQMSQREKEAELVFRGQQYARAIGLFQRRAGPGVNPPNLDVLVQQKFLRKKYKDPITGDDFDLISPGTALAVPTAPGGASGAGRATTPGAGRTTPGTAMTTSPAASRGGLSQPQYSVGRSAQPGGGAPIGFGGNVAGGIVGVQSKSKAESIRIFNGRTHYNEWQFVYIPQTAQPGGRGGPPQPGVPQPGLPPGGPQRGPFGGGRFGMPPVPAPGPGGRPGGPTGSPPAGPRGRGPFR